MTTSELIFMPSPGDGHLPSMVEFAKLLIDRDQRLSITIIVLNLPLQPKHKITTSKPNSRLCFIDIPSDDSTKDLISPNTYIHDFVQHSKTRVLNIVREMFDSGKVQIAGFVVDMFCVAMTDVAKVFEVPTYVYFTSPAAMLGMMFYVQAKHDDGEHNVTNFKDSDLQKNMRSLMKSFQKDSLKEQEVSERL